MTRFLSAVAGFDPQAKREFHEVIQRSMDSLIDTRSPDAPVSKSPTTIDTGADKVALMLPLPGCSPPLIMITSCPDPIRMS